jgi:hypothetical protein
MAEQPTTLFDSPAGDVPASPAYRPGMWLAGAPATGPEDDPAAPARGRRPAAAAPRPAVQPAQRLLLHRLLEAGERLTGRPHDYWDDAPPAA